MQLIKLTALSAILLSVAGAEASVLGGALTFNGTADQVNTINNPVGLSTFFDANTNNVLDAGDIVYGFIASIQVTNDITTSTPFNPNSPVVLAPPGSLQPFGGTNYLASIFSGVVNNGPAPGETFLTAVNPAALTGLSIPELLSSFAGLGGQLDGVTNAVAAVLSGSTAGGVNDLTGSTAASLGSFFTSADFELDFALSVDGGFFQSRFTTGAFGGPQLGQRAGLNVIAGTEGSSFIDATFIPVPVGTLFAPSVTGTDVAVDNTLVALDQPLNGYLFTVQSSSIRLNVIPEATSACIWLGLTSVTFLRARRRK